MNEETLRELQELREKVEMLESELVIYLDLMEILDEQGIEMPYICGGCMTYMNVIDMELFHQPDYPRYFKYETNTWNSQKCDCCPMCAKKDFYSDDDAIPYSRFWHSHYILENGGKHCTECMEWYAIEYEKRTYAYAIDNAVHGGHNDPLHDALTYLDQSGREWDRYHNGWYMERHNESDFTDWKSNIKYYIPYC